MGKTKRQLHIRIGEHLGYIKHKEPKSPLAQHFLLHHQSKVDGLHVKGIYALKLNKRHGDFDKVLLKKFWIYRLHIF